MNVVLEKCVIISVQPGKKNPNMTFVDVVSMDNGGQLSFSVASSVIDYPNLVKAQAAGVLRIEGTVQGRRFNGNQNLSFTKFSAAKAAA